MPASPDATAPRPFTVHDLVRLRRVSDPRVSPDGRWVAYTLRTTDYDDNRAHQQIWLTGTDGLSQPRPLTSSGDNHSARWSADANRLYFLSSRSGSAQIWRLALDGGEAQPVTALPLEVAAFALSPVEDRIAVALEVLPDCAGDLDEVKRRLDQRTARKASGRVYDRLFVRHWDSWKNGTRAQLYTLALDGDGRAQRPVHVSRGVDGDVPTKPFGDDREFSFSPDGRELVFVARQAAADEAWSTKLDLWRVAADGSAMPENLTPDNPATDTEPVYSPDGRQLAWRAMKRPGYEADRYALMLRDLATGTTREIAPDWDRSADALAFSADGGTIYTSADDAGQHRLFAVDIASGSVRPLTGDGRVSGFGLGKDTLVVSHNDLSHPDDLYALAAAGGAMRRLSAHNAQQLANLRFGEATAFSFVGAHGDTVLGHVVRPWNHQPGQRHPTLLIAHGGPQGSMGNDWHYRWNPQTYAGRGYAVVFIDFHGSTGYGQSFTDAIRNDWGGAPLQDLQQGWAHALATFDFLDGGRAAALGASYGGYMINWIAGQWPDAFRALVNHAGVFDDRSMAYSTEELWFDEWERMGPQYEVPEHYERHNPVRHVARWRTPMLVTHGECDYRVPVEQGLATFTALQRRGIPSQLLVFPDENHWILKPQNSVQWHETVEAWLDRWLKFGID